MAEYSPLQRAYLYARRNLHQPASVALATARADTKLRYPRTVTDNGAGNWQRPEDMPRHASPSDREYYSDSFPLPDMGTSYDVMRAADRYRFDSRGWYMSPDNVDGNIAEGHVMRLPGRRGFVPGVSFSGSDGVTCYPNDIHETAEEAARAADGYAERIAEKEREYQEAWQRGTECADLESEAESIRSDIVLAVSDLRTARQGDMLAMGPPPAGAALARLCTRVRGVVRSALSDLYDVRQRRDKLRDEWSHADGFAEGYGR